MNLFFPVFCSAGAGLVYEIASNESLFSFFPGGSYSITIVLITFLFGLALGGFTISRKIKNLDENEQIWCLIIFQLLIAFYSVIVLSDMEIIPFLIKTVERFIPSGNVLLNLPGKFIVSALYLLLPNFLFGASFPLFNSLAINILPEAGKKAAVIYYWDLFGAVFGAGATGFIVLPKFGIAPAFIFGGILNLVSMVFMILTNRSKKRIWATVILFVFFVLLIYGRLFVSKEKQTVTFLNKEKPSYGQIDKKNILYSKNTAYGPVEVISLNNENVLFIGNKFQCSKSFSHNKFLPAFALSNLKNNKINVLIVGYGCGLTTSEFLKDQRINSLDIVEINPELKKLEKYFFQEGESPLKNPKTNLIIADGFDYLLKTEKKYDLILFDIEHPFVSHASSLFTVEGFILASKALNNNGLFELHGYFFEDELTEIMFFSLKEAFPFVRRTVRENVFFLASREDFGGGNLSETERKMQTFLKNKEKPSLNTLANQVLKFKYNELYEKK